MGSCWNRVRELHPACANPLLLTNVPQALDGHSKALGAGQQVVLEAGQSLGSGHLHAGLVLPLREARPLTVDQELGTGQDWAQAGDLRTQGADPGWWEHYLSVPEGPECKGWGASP